MGLRWPSSRPPDRLPTVALARAMVRRRFTGVRARYELLCWQDALGERNWACSRPSDDVPVAAWLFNGRALSDLDSLVNLALY